MEASAKFRIYDGIVCLEASAPSGLHAGWWWDQGYSLGYRPYPIYKIRRIRVGMIQGTRREIIAVEVDGRWIAINPPRSDIPGLQKAGIWPAHMPPPYTEQPTYTPWPEKL